MRIPSWKPNWRTVPRRLPLAVAYLLVLALVVSVCGQAPAYADPVKPFAPGRAKPVPAVRTHKIQAKPAPKDQAKPASARPKATWPGAGSAQVAVVATGAAFAAGKGPKSTRIGNLPVTVTGPDGSAERPPAGAAAVPTSGPSKVRVEVLDRAATARSKTEGVLLRVGRADGVAESGQVKVAVDYAGFATTYGGDWANRLRLVRLPACALQTPDQPACAGTVLPTHNDAKNQRVSADVTLGNSAIGDGAVAGATSSEAMTLLAVSAGVSGASGSFAATSLSSASTWTAGGSSGNFSWSYPMRTPPAQGGPTPTVELSYSSQSVDGRMAASNNQPSIVGEGFELSSSGYVERRYKDCASDMAGGNNTTKTGDLCWATDNATLSLNGGSVELIKDATDPNLWHPRSDDGSRIEHRTGATNGDNNGEWWVVTTTNGTQYWFGRNQLPGWSAGKATTQSTWTEPVFGNNAGASGQPDEPCHAATFAASVCTQAWRWNLDYVVDPHFNTMSFWYTPDSNYYAQNLVTTTPVSYIRDGKLDRVEYGTQVLPDLATGTDTVYSGNATARVEYGYADRCLSGCTNHADPKAWPDTPWDFNCTASTCLTASPTFWSTRRLSTVTTRVWDAATAGFRDVERWTLTHGFPDPEDTTRAGLWLEKISHSGLVGMTTTLPDLSFVGVAMNNRVDTVDQAPAMNWRRLAAINTETGGLISIAYSAPDCVAGSRVPTAVESNTLRCYPVKWTPEGYSTAKLDYFHKYVVTEVTETDLTDAGSTRVLNRYSYLGDPAWHYTDDDGLIAPDQKTWSQWRGYASVGVTVGDPGEQTYQETLYLRGMHGDTQPSGTRSVTVTDSQGGTVVDEDAFAGTVREHRVFNGPGGAEVSGTINEPWQSTPTATRVINGVTVAARYVSSQATHTRVALDGGRGVRTTSTRSQFDAYGFAVRTDNFGDDAVSGDEQCVTTSYEPRNTSAWLLAYPQRAQTFALTCDQVAAGPIAEADVIGDGRTSYDGNAWGLAPVKGDTTGVEQLAAYNGGAPTYLTTSRSTYDAQGRVVESWDVLGNRSATAYTPATGGPVTQTVDTNPRSWTTTSVIDPAWGLATKSTDANGLSTELTYDGLGRLTAAWEPDRVKGTDTASIIYEYLVRSTGGAAVTTRTLNPAGSYITSHALYDGLLRPRQTQTTSPLGPGSSRTPSTTVPAGKSCHSAHTTTRVRSAPTWCGRPIRRQCRTRPPSPTTARAARSRRFSSRTGGNAGAPAPTTAVTAPMSPHQRAPPRPPPSPMRRVGPWNCGSTTGRPRPRLPLAASTPPSTSTTGAG